MAPALLPHSSADCSPLLTARDVSSAGRANTTINNNHGSSSTSTTTTSSDSSSSDSESSSSSQSSTSTDLDDRIANHEGNNSRINRTSGETNGGGVNNDPEFINGGNGTSSCGGITSGPLTVPQINDSDDDEPPEPPPRHAPLRRISNDGQENNSTCHLMPSTSGSPVPVPQDHHQIDGHRNENSTNGAMKSSKKANRSVSHASSLIKHNQNLRGHHKPRHNMTNGMVTISRLPSIPERCGSGSAARYLRVETENLPPNIEARMDAHGRIFYIDHINRTTTWTKPFLQPSASATSRLGPENNNNNALKHGHPPLTDAKKSRQQLDERYNSIRRTISGRSSRIRSRPPIPAPLTGGTEISSERVTSSGGHVLDQITSTSTNSPGSAASGTPAASITSSKIHIKSIVPSSSSLSNNTPNGNLDSTDGCIFSRPADGDNDPWVAGFGAQSPIQPMQQQRHSLSSLGSSSSNRQSISSSSSSGQHPVLCSTTPAPPTRSTSTSGATSSLNLHPLQATLSVPVTQMSSLQLGPSSSAAVTSSGPSSSTVVTISAPAADPPAPTELSIVNQLPAVKFLQRSDFFNLLHLNDEAHAQYNRTSPLKHMISKIRKDTASNTAFLRFQHNRDLVVFLNKFADVNKPLPQGWDSKIDRNNKTFFIDHTTKNYHFY